jgi:hypothetical protein
MAKPRISQFADDLNISRPKANKLMKKARGRKDGGSEILDSYSPELRKKMQRFEDAERIFTEDTRIGTMSDKKKKDKKPKSYEQDKTDNPGTLEDPRDEMNPPVVAKDGKYMSCRGGGKAIQGMKFSGVK